MNDRRGTESEAPPQLSSMPKAGDTAAVPDNDWRHPSRVEEKEYIVISAHLGSKLAKSNAGEHSETKSVFSQNARSGAIRCNACRVVVAEGGTSPEWGSRAVELHLKDPTHGPLAALHYQSVQERKAEKTSVKQDVIRFLKGTGYSIVNGKFLCTVCTGPVNGPSKSVELALGAMERHERGAEHQRAFEQFERSRKLAPAAAAAKPLLTPEERVKKAEAFFLDTEPCASVEAHSAQNVQTSPLQPPPAAKPKIVPKVILKNPNRVQSVAGEECLHPHK
jgi:hypothetical protein